MFSYMAFVWDETDSQQAEAAELLSQRLHQTNTAWHNALRCPGLSVFYSDARAGSSEACRLEDVDAVALGTLFERCDERSEGVLPRKVFSPTESQQVIATGCLSLISSCWGRYVAFSHDRATRQSFLLRDPTGGLPCYCTSFRGVEIAFSSVEDIASLGLIRLTVNDDFITARVVMVFLNSHETGINEISAVLAGERLEFGRGRITRTLAWSPLEISQQHRLEEPDDAARELRRVTKTCVHSWAACYPSLLHRLSGGLDSSIVLGCLQDAPTRPVINCLNYHSAGSNGDERNFAHLAANRAGISLLEVQRSSDVRVEDMLKIGLSAAPTYYLGPLQTSRSEARLAAEMGAAAYFSGNGGDQLFYQAHGILSAADYLHIHGLNRRFVEVALDAAHLEQRSIWHVMGQAYKLGRRRSSQAFAVPAAHRSLVADAAHDATFDRNRFIHPLFKSRRHQPPGKFWHAAALCTPIEFYDPLGAPDDPEPVQPLLSQPLVELCLRIPTYVLTNSGWDRAAARQAFHADVPREILRRRSKGGLEENVQEILLHNLPAARELMLDGHLVKAGLLDRRRLEEVLSDRPTRTSAAMAEIFDHLSTEAWLRRWERASITTTW